MAYLCKMSESDFRINKEAVLKALGTVEEPDLKRDLVSLGMVQGLELGVGQVRFTVVLTTPACPLKEVIRDRCVAAIHRDVDPHLDVQIHFTANVTATAFQQKTMLGQVKNIIAVASGKGGVGKSTVTANLAVALKNTGASVGILDADIYGPSIPIMFGAEDIQPTISVVEGRNLINPVRQFGLQLISMGFLVPADNAMIWRGPMASQALRQLMNDVNWGELDYLLIDLPPGTGDIHLTLVQSAPVTGVVIVTTPQKVALADATKGLQMFKQPQINVPVLGVIENMAWFTPEELPNNRYYLFGKEGGHRLAEQFDVPFLGAIPLVQALREAGDAGRPLATQAGHPATEAFHDAAQRLAQQVAIRNGTAPATQPVEIQF